MIISDKKLGDWAKAFYEWKNREWTPLEIMMGDYGRKYMDKKNGEYFNSFVFGYEAGYKAAQEDNHGINA